jgi:23S rRNA-/tRNA-specific pseudouridylate synthase
MVILEQVSFNVRAGDEIKCTIAELQQLRAVPENIPLDIVYEDDHLLVINKPAHMVIPNLLLQVVILKSCMIHVHNCTVDSVRH